MRPAQSPERPAWVGVQACCAPMRERRLRWRRRQRQMQVARATRPRATGLRYHETMRYALILFGTWLVVWAINAGWVAWVKGGASLREVLVTGAVSLMYPAAVGIMLLAVGPG